MSFLSSPDRKGFSPRATLVVPTYNAIAFIDRTVVRLRRFVEQNPDWCVLFVCDGCSDDTPKRLTELLAEDSPLLRVEIYTENHGKGYALRRGLDLADTEYRFFTDVDLAYDPDEAIKLMAVLKQGFDLAVVNRIHADSRYLISPRDFPSIYKRHLMSRTFNWWLRKMLPISILDTQAGLKGMTAAAWERLSPHMRTDGFFFDVELLARAGAAGMKTGEAPVYFSYVDPTTVRMVRHGWPMLFETLKLRKSLRQTPSDARPLDVAIQPAPLTK
jgi:glycosyltransferase involved in cell wall biosynthesis